MSKTILSIVVVTIIFILGFYTQKFIAKKTEPRMLQKDFNSNNQFSKAMKLGAFSISLSVKDINVSKQFYENLGFTVLGGGLEQNYLIMKNQNAIIGLFQGMFEGNILTFNPGWDENANEVEHFDDVREIQKQLKNKGITLSAEADANSSGPASIMTSDPDGNIILVDQHR